LVDRRHLGGRAGPAGLARLRPDPSPTRTRRRRLAHPDFTLTTFDGETSIARPVGKVLLVNFWASWCKPCEQEAPARTGLPDRNDDVVFLGVDYVVRRPKPGLTGPHGITYPNGPDLRTSISQAFRIRGVPETYVVAPDGTIVSVMIGPYPSLQAIIDAIEAARGGS
jgi:cytochrome c biogenesis protein CcmG/thiol:disulfide interchange protein DsbE